MTCLLIPSYHSITDLAKCGDRGCYDSPWTGLLTSGDGGCHQWMAVGVRETPLGRCNINRTTWERLCDGHTWTHDTWTLDI